MNENSQPSVTFSMLVISIIEVLVNDKKKEGLSISGLCNYCNFSQPTWSRLTRGQSKLDVDALNAASEYMGISTSEIIQRADRLKKVAKDEQINFLPNSVKLTKDDAIVLVAAAVLTFLAVRALK